MHMPTAETLATLLTLTAAAAATMAADHPPRRARHLWRFPAGVTGIAIANIALTVVVARSPEPVPGTILLASTLLLLHAIQRRTRARRPPRPPRPRTPGTTGTPDGTSATAPPPHPSSTDRTQGPAQTIAYRPPPPPSGIDRQVRTAHREYPSGGTCRLPAERRWRNGHQPAEHGYP